MELEHNGILDVPDYPPGTEVIYSPDDPPQASWNDHYWSVMNRAAENAMALLRLWRVL